MADQPKWTHGATLDALLEASDEGVVVFDERLSCRSVGRRVHELFGLDPKAAVGTPRSELLRRMAAASDDPAAILSAVGEQALTHERTVADPIEIHRPRPRTIVWTSVPIVGSGVSGGRIDIIRDVTRERRAELATEQMAKKLEEVSTVDAVTGLPNRRQFEVESNREHRRAQRAWDSYAIARIDVDAMAGINATYGVAAGDELLRRIGEELRSARREYDIVARWDGDEFVILLPGADGMAANTVLKRAVKGLRSKAFEVAGGLSITVCAGAAIWIPPSGESADDIVRRAGAALEVARTRGRSAVEIDAGLAQWKDDLSEG